MSSALTKSAHEVIEQVVAKGNLADLSPMDRAAYYVRTCESLGLNPMTKPLAYLELDGKLVLYATRDATDQLRKINGVSVQITSRERMDDVYIVTARATTPDGRTDESTGAVSLVKADGEWQSNERTGKRFFKPNGKMIPLTGDAFANALMKAETKAKRRVALSICGLGFLDESETDSIPNAQPVAIEQAHPAALPPAPVDADPTARWRAPVPLDADVADLITDAQMHELGALLDQLAYHGIDDEKLLKGICNLSHQDIRGLEIDDLAELTTASAAKILSSYNLKLDALIAKADAKGGVQ